MGISWAEVWPVLTFGVGIVSSQATDWLKDWRQVKHEKAARVRSIEDRRHEFELKTLTELHATLTELNEAALLYRATAKSDDESSARLRTGVQLLNRLQPLVTLLFEEEVKTAAVKVIRAANMYMHLRDESPVEAEVDYHGAYVAALWVVGARIQGLYDALATSAAG